MPFAEDLRRFTFPSLETIKDKNGKPREKHALLPTPSMQNAMDDLVKAYDLSDAGPKDDEGFVPLPHSMILLTYCVHLIRNRGPWFDPTEAVNPAVHRLKQALFHAAITKDITLDPVPPPHPDLTKFFERPTRVATRSAKAVDLCKKEFKVSKSTYSYDSTRHPWLIGIC